MRLSLVAPLCLVFLVGASALASIEVLLSNDHETVIEVSTGKPHLTTVSINGKSYVRLSVAGFENHLPPGHPEVPSRVALIAVPTHALMSYEIEELRESRLAISHDLAYAERASTHCGGGTQATRNAAAYSETYGRSPIEIEEISFAASDKLAMVRFWPARYDAAARSLHWISRMRVRFQFNADASVREIAPVAGTQNSIARYVVLNEKSVNRGISVAPRTDLIIAHQSYRDAIARFIDFKKSMGREVRIHFVSGKSATEIKSIISQEYKSGNPPTETLLIGNIDQIPAWPGSGDNRWTDYNYQTLDNGTLPDVSVGRIPAHNIEELTAFIEKAIAREKEPRNVEDILLTAGRDTSLGCPANVTKVGGKIQAASAKINIIKKYKTEVSTQAIVDAYNASPNIIVYDGHGNRQGMTEVPLLISGLNQLTNRVFPIILDIACLNANWGSTASPRNFAESILLKAGSGAAGIMASGGSGNGHEYFQSIGEIMAKARHNLATDPKMNEIGQVIMAAKVKHGAQDRTYWNYYGDPASSIWESQ